MHYYRLRRVDWVPRHPIPRLRRVVHSFALFLALLLVGLLVLQVLGTVVLPVDFWAEVYRNLKLVLSGRAFAY